MRPLEGSSAVIGRTFVMLGTQIKLFKVIRHGREQKFSLHLQHADEFTRFFKLSIEFIKQFLKKILLDQQIPETANGRMIQYVIVREIPAKRAKEALSVNASSVASSLKLYIA